MERPLRVRRATESKGAQTKVRETRVTDLLKGQVPEGGSAITFEREDWCGEKNILLNYKVTQLEGRCYMMDK